MEKISRSEDESITESRAEFKPNSTMHQGNSQAFQAIKQKKLEALIKENVPRSGSTRRNVVDRSHRDEIKVDRQQVDSDQGDLLDRILP